MKQLSNLGERLKNVPWIATILALCVVVRISVLLLLPSVFAYEQTGAVQGNEAHDVYTQNLLATGVFGRTLGVADAAFPPLYVYTLVPIYGIFGRGHIPVGIYQTLLDALSIVMVYEIGKRLMPRGRVVGLSAGLMYALYPYLVFQNLTLVETALFMTLLHGFVLTMILLRERRTLDRGTWALAAVGGIVLGLGILTRPIIAPFAIFAAVWFLFWLSFKQAVLRLAPVAVVAVLVVIPWIIRNYGVYHTLVPVSTNSGENFWFGNSEYTVLYLRAGYHPSFSSPGDAALAGLVQPQRGSKMLSLGLEYLRDNPSKIPELLWYKFLAYWSVDVFPRHNPVSGSVTVSNYHGNPELTVNGQNVSLEGIPENDPLNVYSEPLFDQIGRTVHRVYFGGLLLLGLVGAVLTRSHWREVSLLWFVQICMTLIYVIFIPATRYRVPTDPMLFLFSAYTLTVLWAAVQKRVSPARQSSAVSSAP